jgi:hypothetical protein
MNEGEVLIYFVICPNRKFLGLFFLNTLWLMQCTQTCWTNSSCQFWKNKVLMTCHSDKMEYLHIFTLQFGHLRQNMPHKWMGRWDL